MPSARTMRRVLNLWPPFLFSGIRVLEISDDWRRVRVVLRAALVQPQLRGHAFRRQPVRDDRSVLDDHDAVSPGWRVHRVGQGRRDRIRRSNAEPVYAEFHLDDAAINEIRAATAGADKYLRCFDVNIRTAQDTVVAKVRKQLYIRRKKVTR
jgi:hypothetical protein